MVTKDDLRNRCDVIFNQIELTKKEIVQLIMHSESRLMAAITHYNADNLRNANNLMEMYKLIIRNNNAQLPNKDTNSSSDIPQTNDHTMSGMPRDNTLVNNSDVQQQQTMLPPQYHINHPPYPMQQQQQQLDVSSQPGTSTLPQSLQNLFTHHQQQEQMVINRPMDIPQQQQPSSSSQDIQVAQSVQQQPQQVSCLTDSGFVLMVNIALKLFIIVVYRLMN